jgi:hypothetical protein
MGNSRCLAVAIVAATILAGSFATPALAAPAANTAPAANASPAPNTAPAPGTAAVAATSLDRAQTETVRRQLRAGTVARTRGTVNLCARAGLACQLEALTASPSSASPLASQVAQLGYGARELQKAYGLIAAKTTPGTVALVGTGTYSNLAADLAVYRSANGLPACTVATGCLRIVNKNGGTDLEPLPTAPGQLQGEEDLASETALDVDMVSAACPSCRILVVALPLKDGFFPTNTARANQQFRDFGAGVETAIRLGARGVSISYGLPKSTYSDTVAAVPFRHPGVAIMASSGDQGANGDHPTWPQNLATVISAGGTSLHSSSTGFRQSAWDGAGSGCSRDLGPAVGQPAAVASACGGHRATSDLSSVADPATGVSVYDSFAPATGVPYGFTAFGGTSASAPFLAAMNVRAGVRSTTIGPNQLYRAPAGSITDVTTGSNVYDTCPEKDLRECHAGIGWDGPTGLGTPNGLAAFG